MKVAVPVWNGRISPVFDVARRLLVVEFVNGAEAGREEASLEGAALAARAKRLAELGVDVLICGALSWPMEASLAPTGIQVLPQMCGAVEDVLRAFASGQLAAPMFLMPGCAGRRRRFRGRFGRGRQRFGFPWRPL